MNEAFISILPEYAFFIDIFSLVLAIELLKYIKINYHIIELIDNKQPLYRSIYSLKLVKLETLKTYIKTNLVHSFVKSFKFLRRALIFFV